MCYLYKLSFLLLFSISALAEGPGDIKPISLEEVFVIEQGYDSNDNIEITVHAELPSACYTANEISINQISSNVFQLEMSIKKKNLTGCDRSPYKYPVGYTQTLSLGELPAGDYEIYYNQQQKRRFNVKSSIVQSIDENIYAPLSDAFIPELNFSKRELKVVLTGNIRTNCMYLEEKHIQVLRTGNVFVVIPKMSLKKGSQCKNINIPLQSIVSLGQVRAKGHYLVHIRGQSGISINKVFHVIKERPSPVNYK